MSAKTSEINYNNTQVYFVINDIVIYIATAWTIVSSIFNNKGSTKMTH